VTQIQVPSIYPAGGCPNDWENGRLRVYVDGAAAPTLDVLLLQLAFVGASAEYAPQSKSSTLFSAGGLFGKNAGTGGVFTTIRIPFGAGVRVTLEQAPSCPSHDGIYWIIVRGVEALPLRIAELELPPEARLTVQRVDGQTLQPLEFVTLASSPPATDGLVFATFFQSYSRDPNYLEGCFRMLGPNADNSTEQFLSSGTEVRAPRWPCPHWLFPTRFARPHTLFSLPPPRLLQDYFLSASYFDQGIFAGASAGLTYSSTYPISGNLSAYKVHDRDLLPFHGGFTLEWRNMESALCPTHELPPALRAPRRRASTVAPMTLTTLVYSYTWAQSATVGV
jgi:hypothetical protein